MMDIEAHRIMILFHQGILPARAEIPLTEAISEVLKLLYNTANRSIKIQYAHKKRREGLTDSDIALLLHSTPTTINR